jgi:hypothetical protein
MKPHQIPQSMKVAMQKQTERSWEIAKAHSENYQKRATKPTHSGDIKQLGGGA